MDLRLFHYSDDPKINHKGQDKNNSRTNPFAVRLLEWIGWYNDSIPERLLGHYRQFQIYKKARLHDPKGLSLTLSYILQYRASEKIRRNFYLFISRVPAIFGYPDKNVEMHAINRLLIYERSSILHEFLTTADTDFEQALKKALEQIQDREFITTPSKLEKETTIKETNTKEVIIKEPATKEIIIRETIPAKELTGKEVDVFSKKQVLILFDLLATSSKTEPLALSDPTKHQKIARFLHALTGKGKDTWKEILEDYQNKNLYTWNTNSERSNLYGILKNIADIAHDAGLGSITSLAELKIKKLQKEK